MDQKSDLWGLQQFFQTISKFSEKNQQTLQDAIFQQRQQMEVGLNTLLQGWQEFNLKALEHPDKIVLSQFQFWQDYLTLCKELSQNLQGQIVDTVVSPTSDKRFQHEDWQKSHLFNFIKQSYLLMSQHLQSLTKVLAPDAEDKISKKLQFYIQQFINAVSPTNFVTTNPEVLEATLTSNGENLLNGFKQFLHDMEAGDGLFKVKTTDLNFFELGKNIAITAGKVIYQNDIMQLIQYQAVTPKVYQNPLLIIPPWINKYYILDLRPENSFIKWLVDQGHTVFLISWVNPDERHAMKQFSDYLLEGPLAALEVIKQVTTGSPVNTLGYCIGGTLLACALSYLSAKKHSPVVSATFLTTLLDFSVPGDLGVFIDEQQINILEQHMQSKGYMEGHIMMSIFSLLRANDLIWSNFVNNYLKGQKPAPFDLLYWNSDPTNIPEKVHSFYLREMYLHNNLIKRNAINLAGIPIDLSKISIPSYFLATLDDHIVPWQSCYKGMQFLNGTKKFALADSGHVAGVINAPHKNKYGYRISSDLPADPLEWLNNSSHLKGSWWSDWLEWLTSDHTGKKVPARKIGAKSSNILEDAPGSYAKLRLHNVSDERESSAETLRIEAESVVSKNTKLT